MPGSEPPSAERFVHPPEVDELALAVDPTERLGTLVRTIETEIVPRLMLAHRPRMSIVPRGSHPAQPLGTEEVLRFSEALLALDPRLTSIEIADRLAAGYTPEVLLLDLLAPAARQLGEWWCQDRCDFTQVTLGLWCAQQCLWDLSPAFQVTAGCGLPGCQALLVAPPGSQHGFGLAMVSEFFRRAGWQVESEPVPSYAVLGEMLGELSYDMLGLSIGAEQHLDGLGPAIQALRRASRNPDLLVLIGGPVILVRPDLVACLGADGSAADAPGAVDLAERLMIQRDMPAHGLNP